MLVVLLVQQFLAQLRLPPVASLTSGCPGGLSCTVGQQAAAEQEAEVQAGRLAVCSERWMVDGCCS
jgi:hypothetical protein